jgi:hypothetical protein
VATFNFTVDREYQVLAPLTLQPNAELQGESYTVQPGETLVYRGVVELDGVPRYGFVAAGRKGYTRDRAGIEKALVENYDALVQVR